MDARTILTKAVTCDRDGCILQALHYYHEGIAMLQHAVKNEERKNKKIEIFERVKSYIDRSEEIAMRVAKQKKCTTLIASKRIGENSTGHSYAKVLGDYLTNKHVKEILIQERYFVDKHDLQNLVHLLEVMVLRCENLKHICVDTDPASKEAPQHEKYMQDIQEDLERRGIELKFTFTCDLQKSKIVLFDGPLITLDPGLHYFKDLSGRFTLGLYDYNLRKCKETEICVYGSEKEAKKKK